jgi:hypothetical protein
MEHPRNKDTANALAGILMSRTNSSAEANAPTKIQIRRNKSLANFFARKGFEIAERAIPM